MELNRLYKCLIVISLFLIKRCTSQGTVLYDWNFSEVTVSGTSTWSEFNTSTYSYFYIKKSSNPTQTGNYNSQGYIGEDTSQSGCTSTADTSYNTGDVSFTIYVYITDLTSQQYLYCKNYFQGAATRRAICVGLGGSNTLFVEVNTSPTLTGNTVEVITQPLTYTLGWNMIGCSSDCLGACPPTANSGDKSIICFNVMHDGSTSTTPSYDHTQRFVDDDRLTTCMAGVKQNINVSKNGLIGMIHELTQYSTRISLPDIQALLTNTCDCGCTSCLANMAPTCLEYIKTAFIAQWDFSQPLYINTVYDQGSGGYNFKLLDNQASYDPIYVNNQGFYFDSNRLVRTTTPWIQSNQYSVTIEGWIRPMALPLKGTIFAFESPIGKTDASITFNGNNIVVTIQMSTVSIPISAPTSGNWYYIGVSIERTANSKSTICAVFGTSTESCSTITSYLNMNTAGDYFQIGSRFTGMIKSLQILDWPKRDYEFYNSYKTSGCTPFNGVSCTHCPICTGTCFSSCNIDEYGSTCSKCYTPNCYSCYAYDFTVCYSCLGNYIFTYSGQSCLGYCGNGIKETILLEGCDDGNTQDGDGCSSTCAVEPGYTCSEKTPTSPSICVRKCDYQFGYYFGYNECNDGNDFALDGCYDCKIEHGWKCVDGSPWNPDDCSELCGDGINYGEHECDDGNNINGDGCSSTCTIEQPGVQYKWICESGNEKAPDFCHEWCGDGFRYENPWIWGPRRNLFRLQEVTCDDGNLRSGEGCDGLCRIEEGFVCAGGSGTNPDVCSEECGDRRAFHYDQCDDGNNDSGDGCDSTCHMEAGNQCLQGTPYHVSICAEICGDYINNGWHTCDDGNLISGDGCSSTCVTEAGYRCDTGNNLHGDYCTELCGDGKNAGLLPCDDGNLMNGDGCNSTCYVETGWTCSGGSKTGKDTCVETCGDGVNNNHYQCDDGNTANGDGCSSVCNIEAGYACILSMSPNYCYPAKRPWINSATINSDSSIITLVFNTTVKLTSSWTLSDWRLEMFGPRKTYSFTYDVLNSSSLKTTASNTIQIYITYPKQLYGYDMENIVLTFIDRTHCVDSTYKFEMINSQFTFTLDGKEVSSNASICETMGLVMFFVFLAYAGFMITAVVFGYDVGFLFDVYTTLQIVYLFPLARLYLPTGLFKFFKSFERLNFISLSIGFWQFNDFIDSSSFVETGGPAVYNFKKMGFTTRSFLDTSSDVLLCIIYISFFPVLIQSFRMLFYNSTMMKNIQFYSLKAFMPILVYITCSILCFTAVMNFIEFNVESNTESTGTFTAYGYLIFIIFFLVALFVVTVSFWWNLRQQVKQGSTGELGDGDLRETTWKGYVFFYWFRNKNFMHYSYPCYFIFRRILIGIILNLMKLDGFNQLLALGLLSVITLSYFTSYQPFRSRIRNICMTINEVAYLSVCMTIFPYVYPDLGDEEFDKMAAIVLGFFLSFLLLSMIISTIYIIVLMIKNKKKQPIFAKNENVVLQEQTNENLRELWTQGEVKPKDKEPKKGKLEEDLAQNETIKALDEKGPKINEKGGLESVGSQNENSEDSESESSSGEYSESEADQSGNPELYGQERRIPQAEINLMETGFSTGMSKLREAQIQQYREKEKQMF